MKTKLIILLNIKTSNFFFLFFLTFFCSAQGKEDLKLWYNTPAAFWEEALPLGNGRIGAMVYGDPIHEVYHLNEETLWSGYPRETDNPKALAALPEIRRAVENGNYNLASDLYKENMQGPNSSIYQPMADLLLDIPSTASKVENFYRDLNLSNACATVRYKIDGITYTRTSFVSYPDQTLIVYVEADRKNSVSLNVSLNSKQEFSRSLKKNQLILSGQVPGYVPYYPPYKPEEKEKGMFFEVQVKTLPKGGSSVVKDSILAIRNADALLIVLSAATSFNGIDKMPATEGRNPSIAASGYLNNAVKRTYSELKNNHINDYQKLFNRVQLSLGQHTEKKELPTDQQLKNFLVSDDPEFIELIYQYGRYLVISSSRAGGMPSNLQGIWNDRLQPGWASNYTNNINVQMNYWAVENANLAECHQPLFEFIKKLSINGSRSAKVLYGIDKGWVVHHNSDLWALTSPVGAGNGNPRWSCWSSAAPWYCLHLWEHYVYNGDAQFLREMAYPLMKSAAEFYLEFLYKDPESGYYISSPSTSPELDFYYYDDKGKKTIGAITKASTSDMQLIWSLFTNCIQASKILNTDSVFCRQLEIMRAQLYPMYIGRRGNLQEWDKDFEEKEPQNRHNSHLWGLYPGNQIVPRNNPELAAAIKRTLQIRGLTVGFWSSIWKAALWARLEDSKAAYQALTKDFFLINERDKYKEATPSASSVTGGRSANLFGTVRQLDCVYGTTAVITEMLVQNYGGEIFLLPALPDEWSDGFIKGIRCKGGFTVDFEWKSGKITKVVIYSALGGNCRIRTHLPVQLQSHLFHEATGTNPNPFYFIDNSIKIANESEYNIQHPSKLNLKETYLIDFDTEEGGKYELKIN